MTEARTEGRPPAAAAPPGMAIGQAVGQAEAVLAKLLAGVLEEAGATREAYLAVQRLSAHGDEIGRQDYARDLSDWLDLDLWSAGELADGLIAEGLLTVTDGTIRLSPAGARLRERAGHDIGALMGPVWAQLDPADIETTVRTLRRVTTLARALQA
jgi:hypothetical protein